MPNRLPIIVLAGSDPTPGPLPQGLDPTEMLAGYKGAHQLPWGRCLAGELVERLKQSDRFEDPILVGPRRVYDGQVDCEIVDVDGNLIATLQCAVQTAKSRFSMSRPIAVSTCDILPTPADLRCLLETCYDPHQQCMFWGQLVEARPEDLGASAWKPSYQFRPDAGQPLTNLYPGHLVVVRPYAVRIGLANYLLQLAYRYRNRDVRKRYLRMVARGLGRLVWEDARNLLAGKLPILSVSIPYYALSGYFAYRRRRATVLDFERIVAKGFLHRKFHRSADGRPVVFSITDILSFAKDIDTKSELAEFGAAKRCDSV